MGKYDDIIDLARPQSGKHARMPRAARAAQFAPFASLTSFAGELAVTDREYAERAFLSEESQEDINKALEQLHRNLPASAVITCFEPYPEQGGRYVTKTAVVRRIDASQEALLLSDGSMIRFCDLLSIREEPE